MGKQAPERSWHSFEEFAEMAGFHSGLETFRDKGFIKWTNTDTEMSTGGVHGISYKVEKDANGNPEICLQHWLHWPGNKKPSSSGGDKKQDPFIRLKTETRTAPDGSVEIRPAEAVFADKSSADPEELDRFMRFLQEVAKEIWKNIARNYIPHEGMDDPGARSAKGHGERQLNRRDEIPSLYDIAKHSGFNKPINLDGMFFNGEFNFGNPAPAKEAPVYPRELLCAMLGIEGTLMDNGGSKPFKKSYSMANPNGGYEGITYGFTPDEKNGFRLSCDIWSTDKDGKKEQTEIYSIGFIPDVGGDMLRLAHLSMLPDDRFAPPDLTDHKGVARAIKAMKYVHMAILQGEMPMISEILHRHRLKFFLRNVKPPVTGPENPRTLLQVFGANTKAVFTEKELGIGSNGAVLIRDFMDKGKWIKQGVGIDWGVTFGDPDKSYYHSIMPNFGRYLEHSTARNIKPYVSSFINLETHEHEDHLRGVAKVIKAGFIMPPVVMNRHTFNTLKRMMAEEGVDKNVRAETLKKFHVIDVHNDVNPQNPGERKKFTYSDTVIEQYTEEVWSESEQRKKYFPVIDAYTKDHPEAKTHIRIGPAGHSAHALMFEVEGVLYTGDYKLDQTLDPGLRTDLDWMAKCRDGAVHIQECTNAARKSANNATAETVAKNRREIIKRHAGQRILADMVGSNAIDLVNFCKTLGEAGRETGGKKIEYIIFAGAANRNKYRDLNQTHDLKKQMRKDFGIETIHIGSKSARQLLSGDKKGNYAVIMTGTQDEPLSVSHRVSRDLHQSIIPGSKDVFMRLQSPIPVGDNFQKRERQNARLREDYGATVYDAFEEAQKGNDIYHSSHASQDDYRQSHRITSEPDRKDAPKDLLKILHHGGPAQLGAMKKILDEEGGRSFIPSPQSLYEIDRAGKTVTLAAELPEERLGYRVIRDDPKEFYKTQRQQTTSKRAKDEWHGKAAEAISRLEQHAQDRFDSKHSHKPTDRGVNLTDSFNEAGGVGRFPPIGVFHPSVNRPYHEKHKNIDLFVGMDAETTGASPAKDRHTSSSFVAADKDGTVVGEKSFHHALPRYLVMTPGALCVTGNNKPEDLYRKGRKAGHFDLREYAWNLFNTYRKWPQELTEDKDARAAFVGFRNAVFDDQITMRMLGMALAGNDMKPMATHGNVQVDLFNLYSVFLALKPDDVGGKRDEKGNYIRTLEVACKSNGVDYHDGHNDLNDARFTLDLFFKLKAKDPDIVEQMLMNADFSASRKSPMIDQILGQGMHPNDQTPVFGYIDKRDRHCRPRIGGLVVLDTEASRATDAIALDLARSDPHTLERLSDDKLLKLMNDPAGPFSVIKLNQSPMLFPPEFIYRDPKVRGRAVGRTPKTTILQRANALSQLSDNNHELGKSFMQRVQELYPKSALCRGHLDENRKKAAANDNSSDAPFRIPNQRIFSLFHVIKGVNQTKSRYWTEAAKLLRLLQPQDSEFSGGGSADKKALWKSALRKIRDLSEEAYEAQGQKDPYIEDIRFLIEWQADDINPQWLLKEDRIRMNALKSAWLHQSVHAFIEDLQKIEDDPEMFKKLVGGDAKAQERWQEMKETYLTYAESMKRSRKYAMTKEKQAIVSMERRNDPSFRIS